MENELKTWLDSLRLDHSPTTIKSYEWELRALGKFYPEREVRSFTYNDLTAYLAARRAKGGRYGKPFSDSAIKRSVNAFRSFFKFHLKGKSPAKNLKRPKEKNRIQRTLSWQTTMDVLAVCETASVRGCRDLALLTLMIDSGLRAAEVCRLELSVINWEERNFPILIKGGHEEYGGFSEETANYLKLWLQYRSQKAKDGVSTLFVSVGGNTPGQPLETEGLRSIFRHIAERANLVDSAGARLRFSPHDLRRTFANLATRSGAPTRLTQVAGRWHNLKIVERYTQAIALEDFAQYYPIKNLMGR